MKTLFNKITKNIILPLVFAFAFNSYSQDTLLTATGYEVYNEKGQKIEELLEEIERNTGEIRKSDTINYKYNNKGLLVKENKRGSKLVIMYGGHPSRKKVNYVFETDYEYNDKGQTSKKTAQEKDEGLNIVNYKYNNEGQEIENVEELVFSGRTRKKIFTNYKYNDKGQLIEEEIQEDSWGKGEINNITRYNYGYTDKGRFLKERNIVWNKHKPMVMRSFFNEEGKKIECRFQMDNDKDKEMDYLGIAIFKYNNQTKLIECEAQIDEDGDGKIENILTINNRYNEKGELVEVTEKRNGKILNFREYFLSPLIEIYYEKRKSKNKFQKMVDDAKNRESFYDRIQMPWREWFLI